MESVIICSKIDLNSHIQHGHEKSKSLSMSEKKDDTLSSSEVDERNVPKKLQK